MEKCREIRRIMLGRVVNDNGTLRAPRENEGFYLNGAGNGFSDVLFFGLMKDENHYKVEDPKTAMKQVEAVFACLGRKVALATHPKAVACINRSGFQDMILYAAEMEGKDLVVTVFTGKHVFGFMSLPRALHNVEKRLPSSFERVGYVAPKDKKKVERKMKKAAKKRKKLEEKLYDIKDRLGVENNDFDALQEDTEEFEETEE